MIQTVSAFEESSAFERSALATVFPLLHHKRGAGGLDLRSSTLGTTTVGPPAVTVSTSSDTRSRLLRDLRPLVFGAAWKVLDLLFELAIWQTSTKKPNALTIADKQQGAKTSQLLPLSCDHEIWLRLAAVYENTVEARHCLVHRSFVFDHNTQITELRDRSGAPVPDISVAEQEAFCWLAHCIATCAIRSRFTERDRVVIAHYLDALSAHHRLGTLGCSAPTRVPETVQVNAVPTDGQWCINTRHAIAAARAALHGRRYFDLEIHFPNSGLPPLRGRLEEAPAQEELLIDPSDPPPWTDP